MAAQVRLPGPLERRALRAQLPRLGAPSTQPPAVPRVRFHRRPAASHPPPVPPLPPDHSLEIFLGEGDILNEHGGMDVEKDSEHYLERGNGQVGEPRHRTCSLSKLLPLLRLPQHPRLGTTGTSWDSGRCCRIRTQSPGIGRELVTETIRLVQGIVSHPDYPPVQRRHYHGTGRKSALLRISS